MKNKLEKFNCPVGITLNIIGGKYKPIILWYLYENKKLRYSELQKMLTPVTAKMLIAPTSRTGNRQTYKKKSVPCCSAKS